MLLADDAGPPQEIGEAAVFIDPGRPDPHLRLLGNRQLLDRPRRADLRAKRAVVFAIPDFRHQDGRPHPFRAGFRDGRLQGVGRAGLHALSALDAFGQELFFGQRSGRADELLAGPLDRLGDAEEGHAQKGHGRGQQDLAPGQVHRGQLFRPTAEREGDGLGRANGRACLAIDALRALPLVVGVRVGLRFTMDRAEVALDALVLVDLELEQIEAADQPEEGPRRADVAAPEPLPADIEKEDAEEDQPDEEPLLERRVEGQRLDHLGQLVGDRVELEALAVVLQQRVVRPRDRRARGQQDQRVERGSR